MPLDYTAAVLDVGDPSGTEQAGLASDLATYLPTREAWIELRKHETHQHLTIDQADIPEAWADALAQAQPGQIAPGTTGGFEHELLEEFLRAVASTARMTLHVSIEAGSNAHHIIEACFKALGRARMERFLRRHKQEIGVRSSFDYGRMTASRSGKAEVAPA